MSISCIEHIELSKRTEKPDIYIANSQDTCVLLGETDSVHEWQSICGKIVKSELDLHSDPLIGSKLQLVTEYSCHLLDETDSVNEWQSICRKIAESELDIHSDP